MVREMKELLASKCSREALLWEKEEKRIRCEVCERRCLIPEGKTGFCGARLHWHGTLYVLTYGNISSMSNNPMSKKPFFHFHPGEYALSIGSWGCNATCPWCQNYRISKTTANETGCSYLSPNEFVRKAERRAAGTSFTFNEPVSTLFEYSLDVMPRARQRKLFNTYVTNGYMTEETLSKLVEAGLDAAQIDVKGCKKAETWTALNVEYVWRNAQLLKRKGVDVEITTLIIPTINDDEACLRTIAHRIKEELGEETPWHVTRYYQAYKAAEKGLPSATPVEAVEKAYKIGKDVGLKFVYTGNVPGHRWENTYCPNCGRT
ncbi:AmmeMemoRadiSam system radical SAM enzyme, partial [Candidatus Bathyarchaeota archaeon]|nr:AmmeMemoRadiSam system radical SAM enzyme [Candidatus Bathyarchaeota archaeon]